jgi:hypothetical protein
VKHPSAPSHLTARGWCASECSPPAFHFAMASSQYFWRSVSSVIGFARDGSLEKAILRGSDANTHISGKGARYHFHNPSSMDWRRMPPPLLVNENMLGNFPIPVCMARSSCDSHFPQTSIHALLCLAGGGLRLRLLPHQFASNQFDSRTERDTVISQ